jgi:thiamine-phosphate pyrophosphorylase
VSSNFIQAFGGTHLYPITDQHLSGLSHAEQVVLLSNCGAAVIQLREKLDTPSKFFEQAESAVQVARDLGAKIIINDRVDIALTVKADGVHLGQEDLPPDAARRVLGGNAIIGLSTHSLQQARLAAPMPIDYVAIGPIFPTTTKQSANAPVGLDGLARVRDALGEMPLVAIGGITCENVRAVMKSGADVVAVIGDIWLPAKDSREKIKRFLNYS